MTWPHSTAVCQVCRAHCEGQLECFSETCIYCTLDQEAGRAWPVDWADLWEYFRYDYGGVKCRLGDQ